MATQMYAIFREQLIDRRMKLDAAITSTGESTHLQQLLQEVDAALERIDQGTYGLCLTCHDAIEPQRLIADPLVSFCLDHLTASEQDALQEDLELAARIQDRLLPSRDLTLNGWLAAYHYEAAGPVSGDYCDLVAAEGGTLYFMLGDVSGKGVAASMLMANLHAMFRTLISLELPLHQMVARAGRLFCESTLPGHYATLICGRAGAAGEVEICNAGHPPPLLMRGGEVTTVEATGMPLGLFCDEKYSVSRHLLVEGNTLLLYTDGIVEALNPAEEEFGMPRLVRWTRERPSGKPGVLVEDLIRDLAAFRSGKPRNDDLAILAIQRGR